MKIKSKIAAELIQSGLVKPYDIVNHSYTDGGGVILKNLSFQQMVFVPLLQQDQILWGL